MAFYFTVCTVRREKSKGRGGTEVKSGMNAVCGYWCLPQHEMFSQQPSDDAPSICTDKMVLSLQQLVCSPDVREKQGKKKKDTPKEIKT